MCVLKGIKNMGHSNYQIGPNRCKSDQIGDTYYQNQDHFIRYKLQVKDCVRKIRYGQIWFQLVLSLSIPL